MSKAYLLVICLLAASFTGCIGGEDLPTEKEDDIEKEETVIEEEEETITPVGEENMSSLKKDIDTLNAKISAYEKPQVYFIDHNETSTLFCEDNDADSYEEKNCYLIAKAFDVNGAIERFAWSSSVADSINMSDGEACEDFLMDDNGGCLALYDWFASDVCKDLQKEVNQTITLTVYDNDGNSASTSYDLDYHSTCFVEEEDTIKIGFLNPITGPLEPDAYGFWWGADQAINDLNEMYPGHNFELIEMDSGCDGSVAAASAEQLVNEGVVAVVGAACSGASMGANAVLSAAGIPMISYASTNPGLSVDTDYPLFYRVVPSDAIQGPAGADMMAYGGVDTGELAILHMTNDYGSGLANSVADAWKEKKGQFGDGLCSAGMQGYSDTETDFSYVVDDIVNSDDCTAVYLSSYIQDAAGIIEKLHDQGWTGKIFAGDGPAGAGLYDYLQYNYDAEDVVVSAPRAGYSYGDFEERYDANVAEVGSIKTYVLTAYDTTMIIGKAIAKQQENQDLTDSIEAVGTNYEGASGLITFLDNGDSMGAGYDICVYDGGGGYNCNFFWTAEDGIQQYS